MYAIRRTAAQQDEFIQRIVSAGLPSIRLDIHGVGIQIHSNVTETIKLVREGYAFFERDARDDPDDQHVWHLISLSIDGSNYDDHADILFRNGPVPPHCLLCPAYHRIYCFAACHDLHYAVGSFFTAAMEAMLYNEFLIVHGAAVVGETGVIFPGALRCGKTTLTLSLIYEGYPFATDDIVLVKKSSLEVYPYPRLLNLRLESLYLVRGVHRDYHKMKYSESFGEPRWFMSKSECAAAPFRCDYVVFPKIAGGESRLLPLSKADAALRLIEQSFYPITPLKCFGNTGENLKTLSRLLADVECFELLQGSPQDSVKLLRPLLGAPPASLMRVARPN
jgi:hypothetical protein